MEGSADRRGFSTEMPWLRTRGYGPQVQGGEKYSPGTQEYLDRLKRQPIESAAAFYVLPLMRGENNRSVAEPAIGEASASDLFCRRPVLYLSCGWGGGV